MGTAALARARSRGRSRYDRISHRLAAVPQLPQNRRSGRLRLRRALGRSRPRSLCQQLRLLRHPRVADGRTGRGQLFEHGVHGGAAREDHGSHTRQQRVQAGSFRLRLRGNHGQGIPAVVERCNDQGIRILCQRRSAIQCASRTGHGLREVPGSACKHNKRLFAVAAAHGRRQQQKRVQRHQCRRLRRVLRHGKHQLRHPSGDARGSRLCVHDGGIHREVRRGRQNRRQGQVHGRHDEHPG